MRPPISDKIVDLIRRSECIIYPFGSFYSSLLANLLLDGVGREIANQQVPKVFFLNPKGDPEQVGMSSQESVNILLSTLAEDDPRLKEDLGNHKQNFLDFVFYDSKSDGNGDLDLELLTKLGIQCVDLDLVSEENPQFYDPQKVCDVLCSLV